MIDGREEIKETIKKEIKRPVASNSGGGNKNKGEEKNN